ncbi:MAG: peptide ABC transporter substrate-binding protein [Chloroflexi bacterium]|nr:peptide ABC transporter substrate-binding protein [Chloroflexota bacterium]
MRRREFLVRFGSLAVAAPLIAVYGSAPQGVQAASAAGSARQAVPLAQQGAAGEVRLPSIEPPTLDPGLAEDSASIDIIAQLFDGLVAYDAYGGVSGVGAESWQISGDGLTYTFKLRQGPTWSDGKAVTAADYAWAWKRNVSPVTASPYANALFPVKNAQAINDGNLDPEQLGVQALDDRTLVVTLEKPASYFLRLASTWTLFPLRQDTIEANGDAWTEPATIVTNGPFTLKEWVHETRIVLERNERYVGQKPRIQRAVFRAFPEDGSEQMLAAYEAGEIDTTGAGVPAELPTTQIDRILADPVLSSQVIPIEQSATAFLAINHRQPHFQDARVRQALGLALDRRLILDAVLKRAGEPAYGLHPDGIIGRQPDLWPHDDVAKAQQLLADAGYPGGRGFPTITFTYNTSAEWRIFAEYLQARWLDTLGITVKLESMEWATFLRFRRGDEWTQRGDLFRGSWFSDYEDPNNWYNLLWDSASDPTSFNGGWKNAQFDALVRQATGEQDDARRAAQYQQADAIMAQEYPHIPLFHYEIRSLVKPYLKGYDPARVLGLTPLRTMSLDAR